MRGLTVVLALALGCTEPAAPTCRPVPVVLSGRNSLAQVGAVGLILLALVGYESVRLREFRTELRHADLLEADDQLSAATGFFVSHLEALTAGG